MGFETKNNIEQKPEENRVEMQSESLEKGVGIMGEAADYSGAVKKTSAEEIRLVRKLDFRIMPTLWAMYFLNYVRVRFLDSVIQTDLTSSIEMPLRKLG